MGGEGEGDSEHCRQVLGVTRRKEDLRGDLGDGRGVMVGREAGN
jgi:hypothetical protein